MSTTTKPTAQELEIELLLKLVAGGRADSSDTPILTTYDLKMAKK